MEPTRKDEILGELGNFLYTIVDNDSYDNVCFTYRTSNKLAGQHYKIALNQKLPEELKTFLLCHEAGHILCRHVAARTTLDYEFTEKKIRAVYKRLEPLFDGQDIDQMYDIFEDYIFNMLNDWEVNTKYFTPEEIEYWDSLYPEECCSGGSVHHMLPQEVGYPPGLTANEYLLLILQSPEQWFKNMQIQQAMQNQKKQHQNGTQGGCNTNQHQPQNPNQQQQSANNQNHNKQNRDRSKQSQKNSQNSQGGQNPQQNDKSSQNSQQNNQSDQIQQREGTDAQNQAAVNEQHEQNWHDGKQEQSGSSNNGKKDKNGDENEQRAIEQNNKEADKNSDENQNRAGGGDGGSSDLKDGDRAVGENSNEQPQLTEEQLKQLVDQLVKKMVSDYQRVQEAKVSEAKAKQNDMATGYSRSGTSGGNSGTALQDEVTNWSDYDGLEKQVHELLINKCTTTTKRDLLYNYNRGRFSGDVCVPRYRTQTTYDEVPMTVLMDVSGSISQSDILGFTNIFKNVAKNMSKKCTIIYWDEELRGIYDSKDPDIRPVSGGGTDIGKGIEYVANNMQPGDVGNLFVVSDCCDNLEDWLNTYKGIKYCVCWTNNDTIRSNAGSLYNDFMKEFEKVLVKN